MNKDTFDKNSIYVPTDNEFIEARSRPYEMKTRPNGLFPEGKRAYMR
jgi:hypothetical protein